MECSILRVYTTGSCTRTLPYLPTRGPSLGQVEYHIHTCFLASRLWSRQTESVNSTDHLRYHIVFGISGPLRFRTYPINFCSYLSQVSLLVTGPESSQVDFSLRPGFDSVLFHLYWKAPNLLLFPFFPLLPSQSDCFYCHPSLNANVTDMPARPHDCEFERILRYKSTPMDFYTPRLNITHRARNSPSIPSVASSAQISRSTYPFWNFRMQYSDTSGVPISKSCLLQ